MSERVWYIVVMMSIIVYAYLYMYTCMLTVVIENRKKFCACEKGENEKERKKGR